MKTLLLNLQYPSRASYYDDWRDAFSGSPLFQVTARNIFGRLTRRRVAREIGTYDLVVLLHSCSADSLLYLRPLTATLQSRRGQLIAFVGNELNSPWSPLGEKIAWLKSVAPDIVATQLLLEAGLWLYAEVGARVISLPHALNPAVFRRIVPQDARPIDIGARSFRYLAYLGDNDRNRIYDFFATNRFDPPVVLDFSNEHRFDRRGWAVFLNRCKATIGTEAGSWYLEKNDTTVHAIREYVASRSPGMVLMADSPLRRLWHHLPFPVKAWAWRRLGRGPVQHEAVAAERIDFNEIYTRFFAGKARPPAYGKCVSSRHFDAIGTQTLQIMFPGRYNDILRAGEHYLALKPDFSNQKEVFAILQDTPARERIVARAHDFVMSAHTYDHRLQVLAAVLQ